MLKLVEDHKVSREHRKSPSIDSRPRDYDLDWQHLGPKDQLDDKKILLPISKREIMKLFSLPKSTKKKHLSLFNVGFYRYPI